MSKIKTNYYCIILCIVPLFGQCYGLNNARCMVNEDCKFLNQVCTKDFYCVDCQSNTNCDATCINSTCMYNSNNINCKQVEPNCVDTYDHIIIMAYVRIIVAILFLKKKIN